MIRCLPIFASLLVAGLCGSLSGCSKPIEQGRYETIILHTMALEGDSTPAVVPVVNEKCDGSGFITHGDGHRTPCPGCENCRKQSAVTPRSPLCECKDCNCNPCVCNTVPEKPTVKPAVLTKPSSPGTDADTDWEPRSFFVCDSTECEEVRAPVRRYRGKLWGWYRNRMYVIYDGKATLYQPHAAGESSGGCASCGAGRFGRRR